MENIKKLEKIFVNGQIIDLQTCSIIELEKKSQELDTEQKNIKNKIFNILESI